MNIAGYTVTPNTITVVVDGATRIIDKSRAGFDEIPKLLYQRKRALTGAGPVPTPWAPEDENKLLSLLDMRKFLVRQTHGAVEIGDYEVRFEGKPIGGALVERLIEMQTKGYDTEPLSKFLTNLMANPSETARNELYLWLEGAKLPITDDGFFLAWKAVRHDYKSYHDGRTMNRVGDVLEMPRHHVDPDRDNTCSTGFHFCSYEYLPGYACSNSKIMVVKIDPADVVTIPSDYNNTKGRAWRYTVIAEVPFDEVPEYFKTPVVSADVGEIEQLDPSEWDGDDDEAMDAYDMGPDLPDDRTQSSDQDENTTGLYDVPEAPVVATPTYHVDAALEDAEPEYPNKRTLRSMLKKWGQRGTARETGIPRTTLQGLIKRYWPDKG